jgi:N4-gp56 family major capsid protein
MATVGDLDLYYSDEPFSVMTENQRTWLDPDLIDIWRLRSVFRPLITFTRNLGDVRATSMTVTQLLDPHPDTSPLSPRQIWMPSMHLDSRAVEIAFQHNGNKIAYHKYDDMITYWRQNRVAGLRNIARGALGTAEVDMNDLLARNALIDGSLTTGYSLFGSTGSGVDFTDISPLDLYDPYIGADIWLGMSYRNVPGAMGASGAGGNMICFTSPGVIHDIQTDDDWEEAHKYANQVLLLNYEAGSFKNVRYVQTPKCTLWNCGDIIARAPINAVVHAGDGAPAHTTKVDGTYKVGQQGSGVVNFISLGSFSAGAITDIEVGDVVTFHRTTTNGYGVTGGVDFTEGLLTNRRVVQVDDSNGRLVLDMPFLVDYDTDLGSGVYGYVTLGRNIHASIFIGGEQALVAGVAQQPLFYELDPIDDFKAIYRFSFDQYIGYQPYRPEVMEVVFTAGTTRIKGPAKVR